MDALLGRIPSYPNIRIPSILPRQSSWTERDLRGFDKNTTSPSTTTAESANNQTCTTPCEGSSSSPSTSPHSITHPRFRVLQPKDLWKRDRDASKCENPLCTNKFGVFLRRHHCRKCGGIFCASCSSETMKLIDMEPTPFLYYPPSFPIGSHQITTQGVPSRVCNDCFANLNGLVTPLALHRAQVAAREEREKEQARLRRAQEEEKAALYYSGSERGSGRVSQQQGSAARKRRPSGQSETSRHSRVRELSTRSGLSVYGEFRRQTQSSYAWTTASSTSSSSSFSPSARILSSPLW